MVDHWKKCYNVRQMKVSGESGATVDSWRRGFLIFYRATVLRIYGISMRLDVFGKLFRTKVSTSEQKHVRVDSNPSSK